MRKRMKRLKNISKDKLEIGELYIGNSGQIYRYEGIDIKNTLYPFKFMYVFPTKPFGKSYAYGDTYFINNIEKYEC
jgi:hypothetical protein